MCPDKHCGRCCTIKRCILLAGCCLSLVCLLLWKHGQCWMQEETHHSPPEAPENHCEMQLEFYISSFCLSCQFLAFLPLISNCSLFNTCPFSIPPSPATSFVFISPVVFSLCLLLCLDYLFTAILRTSPAPPNLPDNGTALSANSLTPINQLNTSPLSSSVYPHLFQHLLISGSWFPSELKVSPPSQCHLLTSCSLSASQPPLPLSPHLERAELEEQEVSPTTAKESKICSHISNTSGSIL